MFKNFIVLTSLILTITIHAYGQETALSQTTASAAPAIDDEIVRLQVFLDNHNFGPGAIDGKGGEFTDKAITKYRESVGKNSGDAPKDNSDIPFKEVSNPYTEYVVTEQDKSVLGPLPQSVEEKGKLKALTYQTVT